MYLRSGKKKNNGKQHRDVRKRSARDDDDLRNKRQRDFRKRNARDDDSDDDDLRNKRQRYDVRKRNARDDDSDDDDLRNKRQRDVRKRNARDDDALERKREKDRLRKRNARQNMSDTQRKQYNILTKCRMRKYRLKLKAQPKPKLSKLDQHKLRKKWRDQKQKERANMSPEMKAQKAREVLSRKLKEMNPSDFADLFQHVSTPSKKAEMEKRGYVVSPISARKHKISKKITFGVKDSIRKLKLKKDNDSRAKVKLITSCFTANISDQSKIRQELGIKWHTWKKYSKIKEEDSLEEMCTRNTRSDAVDDVTKENVVTCFRDSSTALPLKKMAGKFVMADTTKRLHTHYLESNPPKKVCLSLFRRLRPREVLTVDHNVFIGCVCEYCLNIQYKVKALQQTHLGSNILPQQFDKYDVLNYTMCPKSESGEFHDLSCVLRICPNCGVQKLKNDLMSGVTPKKPGNSETQSGVTPEKPGNSETQMPGTEKHL